MPFMRKLQWIWLKRLRRFFEKECCSSSRGRFCVVMEFSLLEGKGTLFGSLPLQRLLIPPNSHTLKSISIHRSISLGIPSKGKGGMGGRETVGFPPSLELGG